MQGKSRVTAFWGVKGMKVADALQTQWLQSSKLPLATSAQKLCTESFVAWVTKAEQDPVDIMYKWSSTFVQIEYIKTKLLLMIFDYYVQKDMETQIPFVVAPGRASSVKLSNQNTWS